MQKTKLQKCIWWHETKNAQQRYFICHQYYDMFQVTLPGTFMPTYLKQAKWTLFLLRFMKVSIRAVRSRFTNRTMEGAMTHVNGNVWGWESNQNSEDASSNFLDLWNMNIWGWQFWGWNVRMYDMGMMGALGLWEM